MHELCNQIVKKQILSLNMNILPNISLYKYGIIGFKASSS